MFLQKFGPLVGGILVPLGGLWLKLKAGRQDPAAVRSMKQHSKLHEALPESTRTPIEELIRFEADTYAAALMRKGKRTVNGGAVAAFIFIGVLTGGVVYGFIALGLVWWPGFIIAAGAGAFGGLLLIVGAPQLFNYAEEKQPEKPLKAAKAA